MSRFVGRETELGTVVGTLLGGDGRPFGGLVWITGEAGIGKTALADRAATVIREQRPDVDVVRGVTEQIPLRPFAALVEAFSARILPEVQSPLGAALQVPAAVQVAEAVAEAITSRVAPLVVVLDDVHRADDDTVAVVVELARLARSAALGVIVTARDPAPGSRLDAAIRTTAGTTRIRVGPLAAADLRRLVERHTTAPVVPVDAVPDAMLDAVLDSVGGNPLLALAAAAHPKGFGVDASLPGVAVPQDGSTIALFVHRGLGELGALGAEVVRAIAIARTSVGLDEIAAVTGTDLDTVARLVDRATVSGLVAIDTGPAGVAARIRHDLIAVEILDSIAPAASALLHRRFVAHLAAHAAAPHRLVVHAAAGGLPDHDADAVATAVERVVGAEPSAALAMIDLVAPAIVDAGAARRLAVTRVRALAATGRAVDAAAAARALITVTDDPAVLAAMHRELALVAIVQARPEDAATEMSASLGLLDDDTARARARAELAVAFLVTRDMARAHDTALEAIADAERVRDPVALTGCHEVELFVAACRGDEQRTAELRDRLDGLLTLSGVEPAHVYQPWLIEAVIDLDLGATRRAAETAAAGRAAASRHGTTWAVPAYDAITATALALDGALADARAVGVAALAGSDAADPFGIRPWVLGQLAAAHLMLDDVGAARDAVERGAAIVAMTGPTLGSEHFAIASCRLAALDGRFADGFAVAMDWWELYEVLPSHLAQARLAGDLARAASALGDRTASAAIAERAARWTASSVPALRAQALEARAWATATDDDIRLAADAWAAAPTGAACAALERMATMPASDRAVKMVRGRCELLRRQLGIGDASLGSARTSVSGVGALTRSELDVARLVADGLSNTEIAERLFVSRRTVESHMGAVYRKLGVSSRVQVAQVIQASTR